MSSPPPESIIRPEAVKAVAGHVYALHVRDHETDYYVMFRVESLDPNGVCKLG